MNLYLALFLIGLSVAMLLICHRLTTPTAWDKILVNISIIKPLRTYSAVVFFASLTILLLILVTLSQQHGKKQHRESMISRELGFTQKLGESLGKKLSVLAPANSNAIVINRIYGKSQQEFHDEFVHGLRTGIFRNIKAVDMNIWDPPAPTTQKYPNVISEALNMTANELDKILENYPKANIVISLVGIPSHYLGSKTWYRVSNQEILFIAVANDVYKFGEFIISREITACVMPRMLYSYDRVDLMPPVETIKESDPVFEQLYYYIDASNVVQIMMQNGRLFKFERQIML